MSGPPSLETLRQGYQSALLAGKADEAGALIQQALIHFGVTRLYLDMISPVQAEMGRLWCDGELHIAQEHLATQIVINHLSKLRQLMRPKAQRGLRVLLTTISGDLHTIGIRMVADFLNFDGWEVDFLGADTPASALIVFMQERRVDLVGLSATLDTNLDVLLSTVAGIRQGFPDVPIMVGGQCCRSQAEELNGCQASIVTGHALNAVEEARRLTGVDKPTLSLDHYLNILGNRVQTLRKSRGWSQQQLAEEASLDRTYISSVEHGRQNLTLSVALKLADALSVPLEVLLSQDFLATSAPPRESL